TRQGFSAPAHGRAGGVRAIEHVHLDAQPFPQHRVRLMDVGGRSTTLADLRLPAKTEQYPAIARISAQNRAAIDTNVGERAVRRQDAVAPDDQRPLRERWIASTLERHLLDPRESFRRVGRFQLALIAELNAGAERADITLDGPA